MVLRRPKAGTGNVLVAVLPPRPAFSLVTVRVIVAVLFARSGDFRQLTLYASPLIRGRVLSTGGACGVVNEPANRHSITTFLCLSAQLESWILTCPERPCREKRPICPIFGVSLKQVPLAGAV